MLEAGLERLFERYDAIITPATSGQAPLGLESTGSPAFCTTWTLTDIPAVSVSLLEGADGMPVGVQVVGRWHDAAAAHRALAASRVEAPC